MALTIRMRQQGAKGRQKFRLVITDERAPRDGKYLEMLGWYNPYAEGEKNASVDAERVQYWLNQGAQISDRAKALVKKLAPNVIQALVQKQVAKTVKRREKKKKA